MKLRRFLKDNCVCTSFNQTTFFNQAFLSYLVVYIITSLQNFCFDVQSWQNQFPAAGKALMLRSNLPIESCMLGFNARRIDIKLAFR